MPHYMVFSIWNFTANFILPPIPCALVHTCRSSMHWFWIPSHVFFNTVLSPPPMLPHVLTQTCSCQILRSPHPHQCPTPMFSTSVGNPGLVWGNDLFEGTPPHPRSRENPINTLSKSHNELQNKNLLTFLLAYGSCSKSYLLAR